MSALSIVAVVKIIILIYLVVQFYIFASVVLSKRGKFSIMAKNSIDVALGKSKSTYFSYEKITADLSKYGVMFVFNDYNLEPSSFIAIKILSSISTAIISLLMTDNKLSMLVLFVAGVILGFFIPDLLMHILNASDNEDMAEDILTIYTVLKIHARAGVYITDSLIECQRSVSNKRLKQAINEMNNNILSSRITVEEAVDQFNARFCNEQIDNLAIIIKQAIRTGRSADLLDDISKQIDNNSKLRTQKKKDQLKRQTAIIQVTFFALISVMLVFLIAMEMAVSVGSIR